MDCSAVTESVQGPQITGYWLHCNVPKDIHLGRNHLEGEGKEIHVTKSMLLPVVGNCGTGP